MSKSIVILGGGIGGIATAYNLRKIDKNLKITVLSDRWYFGFTPSWPHLALGWRKFEDLIIPLDKILPKHGIEFINESAEIIEPEFNRVKTKEGKVIEYDYLVIATGPKLVYSVEGQDRNSTSICTGEHALELQKKLMEFYENPGPIVVGAVPGVSCFGPAYEFIFMLDYELRRRKIRDRVSLTYITSEPYIGHFGLGSIGTSRELIENLMKRRNINWITNVKITRVDSDKVVYEDLEGRVYELPSKLSMIMPRFMGPSVVESAGDKVASPTNKMVIVNKCFQNPTYKNIFGVGVVTYIPPVEQTPIPTGVPKTGMMIEQMATAVAYNIVNDIKNIPDRYTPELSAICMADMGQDAVLFFVNPVLPPRKDIRTSEGRVWHYAKSVFEKYFLWKVRTGNISPWFEEVGLKVVFNVHPIHTCKSCDNA